MAFDLDNEELKATRKLHNQDDGLYEETSKKFCEYEEAVVLTDNVLEEVQDAINNILTEREQDKKRIQELKEEDKKLKASHIFTRNNNATDEEKAKLYDVIDNTIDTFLEQKNQKWEQIMTTNKMSVDEAIDIVDKMYQDRYKAIEKDDTILVNKLDDIKFTNLEFASVILLREVQSLQSNLENSIPKQKVKEALDDIYDYLERLNGPDEDIEYIENKRRELLEDK